MIREATLEDVAQIAQVHVDTWRTAYRGIVPDHHLANLSYERRAEGWRQILQGAAEDGNFMLVVEQAGRIVGFANGGPERSGDPIYRGELTASIFWRPTRDRASDASYCGLWRRG